MREGSDIRALILRLHLTQRIPPNDVISALVHLAA